MTTRFRKSRFRFLAVSTRSVWAAGLLIVTTLSVNAQNDITKQAAKIADDSAAPTEKAGDNVANVAEPGGAQFATESPKVESVSATSAKKPHEKSAHEKLMELMGLSLGCVATVLGLGIAILAIWCDYRKRRDLIAACHRERVVALEKGLDLPPFPPELMICDTSPQPSVPGSGLKPGLMWFAIGIGLWLFLSPKNHGLLHPSVGAIPGTIGVAYLVYYVLEGRRHSPVGLERLRGQ